MGLNIEDVLIANDEMSEAIQRVRELHYSGKIRGWDGDYCYECSDLEGGNYKGYPCDTIKALDGE